MQKMLHIFPYSGKCSDVQSCPTLCDPVAWQARLFMVFSRQEYWSGLPYPHPKDLPDPGIQLWSPTFKADSLPPELPGKPLTPKCIYLV